MYVPERVDWKLCCFSVPLKCNVALNNRCYLKGRTFLRRHMSMTNYRKVLLHHSLLFFCWFLTPSEIIRTFWKLSSFWYSNNFYSILTELSCGEGNWQRKGHQRRRCTCGLVTGHYPAFSSPCTTVSWATAWVTVLQLNQHQRSPE